MNTNTTNRAFTLLEAMIGIAVLSAVVVISFSGVTEMRTSVKSKKLKQDVAVVNSAVRMYLTHGGEIGTLSSPQAIINKLKTVPTGDSYKQISGLRESMVDSRLEAVMQTDEAAATNAPRALWDARKMRFVVAQGGERGIAEFRLKEEVVAEDPVAENREVSLKLAKNSTWVWDYVDSSNGLPERFGLASVNPAIPGSYQSPKADPGPLALNPPSFSVDGGVYELADFENLQVSLSNPNPSGSSQVFYSTDGSNWHAYSGQSFNLNPGDSVQAFSASLDHYLWADSPVEANNYSASPVQLVIAAGSAGYRVTYPEVGGLMVSGDTALQTRDNSIAVDLVNSAEIPNRYQNSDSFNVLWSYDGGDPLVSATGASRTFSNGYPGSSVDFSLDKWGESHSLPIRIVAKSLNTDALLDSSEVVSTIEINPISLGKPSSDVLEDGNYAPSQQISLMPPEASASLPEGWRIYYTTDGTDPGHAENGEPERGTLYTGAFDLFSGSSAQAEISARVYGPSGYAHWFNPSAPYSISLSKWQVPNWDGYIGGNFRRNTHTSFQNIKAHLAGGPISMEFNPGSGLDSWGKCLAVQPDGKSIVGGAFTTVDGVSRNRIARFNVDGSLDGSFDPGLGFDDEVLAVALQPDGKVLVGGKFKKFNNVWRKGLARLNTDGSLDWSFNVGQAVHSDEAGWVHAIVLQDQRALNGANGGAPQLNDYKVIVCGCFSRYNYRPAYSIARVDMNGRYDRTFYTRRGVAGFVHAAAVQDDGKVVIAGTFSRFDGVARRNIARVLADGRNDTSFDPGAGTDDEIKTVELFADGKIFIGGLFDRVNSKPRKGVARLNTDGSLDTSFNLDAKHGIHSWEVYSSSIGDDGRILVGGKLRSTASTPMVSSPFLRLHDNGSIDVSYRPEDLADDASVYAIKTRGDGTALITGDFPAEFVVRSENIARLNTFSGHLDESFEIGAGAEKEVHVVLKLSDGDILIGGGFSTVKGTKRSRLAKLGPDGTVRPFSVNIEGGDVLSAVEMEDGRIVIGGDFTSVSGNPALRRVAVLTEAGAPDLSFSPQGTLRHAWVQTDPLRPWRGYWGSVSTAGFNKSVHALSLTEDGRILAGGEFDTYGDFQQPHLALLNGDGTLSPDLSLANGNVPVTGSVHHVMSLPDGGIIYTGSFSGSIRRLRQDGSRDSGFASPGINGPVYSCAIKKDGRLLIGGDFTRVDGFDRQRVAVLNADGTFDSAFDSGHGANGAVYRVLPLDDSNAVVLGAFTTYGGHPCKGVARISPDGSIDTTFANSTLDVTAIHSTN
ncbi:MAG: chitobiase/beta-hexosaminidase C-terminal domain-containing protein [Verrucomicrobiales bacterium]|nr:chitobiase/beta-hexosaminidase C-terminal domain-containing protein [Verrucomicrobiales bacterium]